MKSVLTLSASLLMGLLLSSAYRVTIPAVLHIACLRRMLNHTQT